MVGMAGAKASEALSDPDSALFVSCRVCVLQMNEDEFVESFQPTLMEAVGAWYRGVRFADLMKMTEHIHEGSIIRVIRRLEEVMRQLTDAVKAIGEDTLAEKFGTCGEKIKRDVIFAASLYL